jgi:hypothetical protein
MTRSLDCLAEDRVEACRAVARARGASIGLSRTMLLLEFDKTVVPNAARKGEKHHEAHIIALIAAMACAFGHSSHAC